jgi:hypothetical protein
MNTGAASLSDEQWLVWDKIAQRTILPIGTQTATNLRRGTPYKHVWNGMLRDAALATPTPQADAAPIINGHAVNDLFLKWSEWTTELGEAISRKNIDGFVSELRAAIAAGGAQEALNGEQA